MTIDDLDRIEKASIREFVESCAEYFTGRVLDYGCGRQPYRDVIEKAGGRYHGFDLARFPGGSGGDNGDVLWLNRRRQWEAVLCTQVVQYVPQPAEALSIVYDVLRPDGVLVLTGPTCWPEIPGHLWSFTREGIRHLLESVGFAVERVEPRASVEFDGFVFSLGWGAVGRA